MKLLRSKRCLAASLALSFAFFSGGVAAKNVALLLGVGQHKYLSELPGAANDALAMRDVLIEKWNYAPENIVVLTDGKATKSAIISELQRLLERTEAGDNVLIYFSGHGTSVLDSRNREKTKIPYCSGALVVHDTSPTDYAGTLLQGKRDLKPVLKKLDEGGRRVWVISDSCFSGQLVRSLDGLGSSSSRFLPMPFQNEAIAADLAAAQNPDQGVCETYDYKNTVFLSAASEGEQALDIDRQMLTRYPTVDGKPHGAMTDALLRIFQGKVAADFDGDGKASLNEIHRTVSDILASRGFPQTPQKLPTLPEDVSSISFRSLLDGVNSQTLTTENNNPPLRVYLGPELGKEMVSAVSAIKGIVAVPDKSSSDLRLFKTANKLEIFGTADDLLSSYPAAEAKQFVSRIRQYSWAARIRNLASANSTGFLPVDFNPARFGGNYLIGEKFNLLVKGQKSAYTLVVDVDSKGMISVLYPFSKKELKLTESSELVYIPAKDDYIYVKEPEGTDVLLAFSFSRKNPVLEKLVGLTDIDTADPRLNHLEQMLREEKGNYSFYSKELRVSKAVKRIN